MASAQHEETFNCTVDEFYKIISDYEKYPEFLQEVKHCKVIKTDGSRKLVEFKISVLKTFTYQTESVSRSTRSMRPSPFSFRARLPKHF